jgi:SWI/SNF-related matrix-associated actin-dependent regulator of chromatin subfamily A member 5
LDEAQRIKNDQTLIGQAARRLRGVHKLLITGTPLQNDMHELWALLNFLLPDVFESCEMFDEAFQKTIGQRSSMNAKLVAAAHRLLQPLMLRRLKKDVQKDLPPKSVLTLWCPLTSMQKFW